MRRTRRQASKRHVQGQIQVLEADENDIQQLADLPVNVVEYAAEHGSLAARIFLARQRIAAEAAEAKRSKGRILRPFPN